MFDWHDDETEAERGLRFQQYANRRLTELRTLLTLVLVALITNTVILPRVCAR